MTRVALRAQLGELARLLLIATAYFASARVGFLLAFATRQVTAVWPPTGVALAALCLFGFRIWPAIFVGAFLANATAGEAPITASLIAVGNTLGPLLSAWLLLRRKPAELEFATLRSVAALFIAASCGMLLTAANGVFQLALAGLVAWKSYGAVWWVWWVGDAMGALLLAPALLTWAAQCGLPRGLRLFELAASFLLLTVTAVLVFGPSAQGSRELAYHLQYAVFPPIIWAALRFGPRETSSAIVLVSGVAVWSTSHARGPFGAAQLTLDERLILLELFMLTLAATGLTLAAVSSERRRAASELRKANERLEERVLQRTAELGAVNADLAKKNEEVEAFVYIVSHDLRGPLVNLQGFASELAGSCAELDATLGRAALPPELDAHIARILHADIPEALHFISASTTKFQRLIDALIELSRTGRQEYERSPLNVRAVVDHTVDSLRHLVDESGASVVVQSMPDAVGDATAIGQVFANLIGNALKYLKPGRPGQIIVGGHAEGRMREYFVRDNGSGIPESAHERVFQVFQRFHPELAGGDGMGLAIVKRVIERHGGSVRVESREDAGTTFYLSLPGTSAGSVLG